MEKGTASQHRRPLPETGVCATRVAGDDHPAVLRAIIGDRKTPEGSRHLNPQPMPPGDRGFALSLWAARKIWGQWSTLRRQISRLS